MHCENVLYTVMLCKTRKSDSQTLHTWMTETMETFVFQLSMLCSFKFWRLRVRIFGSSHLPVIEFWSYVVREDKCEDTRVSIFSPPKAMWEKLPVLQRISCYWQINRCPSNSSCPIGSYYNYNGFSCKVIILFEKSWGLYLPYLAFL